MDIENLEGFIVGALVVWYMLSGFSFAKTNSKGRIPFGLLVVFWVVLQPIDGLFKGGE